MNDSYKNLIQEHNKEELEKKQKKAILLNNQIKKLIKTEKKEYKEILSEIKKKLQNDKILKQIKDKKLIIILGNTGSGKSTLTNFLINSKLKKIYDHEDSLADFVIDVEDKNIEFSQIGHNYEKSKTEGFKLYFNKKENLVLLDTQGFFDSRGVDYEISFSLLFEKILENCKSLKFILLSSFANFESNRSEGFRKNLNFFEKLFVSKENLKKYQKSIMLLITKNKRITLKKIKSVLIKGENIICKILLNRVFIYSPLNEKQNEVLDKNEFIKELKSMEFFEDNFLEVPLNLKENDFLNKSFLIFQ